MPVSIAGMHRSGTSMIARLLNLAGLDLGPKEQLMPAAADNPEGFWECMPFVHLNEKVMGEILSLWYIPVRGEPGWENFERMMPWREWAARLPGELGLREPWGWKDPRNTLTFPFWNAVWPDLRVVICVRHPFEVASSLLGRNGFTFLKTLRLWLAYYEIVLDAVPPERRIITHYESFFTDAASELNRLSTFLDLPDDETARTTACECVVKGLRHSQFETEDLGAARTMPELAAMYNRLEDEGGPVFANRSRRRERQMSAVTHATLHGIELEQVVEERDAHIREMEVRDREHQQVLAEARHYGEQRDYWVRVLEERLAARRHRYADQAAEMLLKVAAPFRRSKPE